MSRQMEDQRLQLGTLNGKPRWYLDGIPVSRLSRRRYINTVLKERAKARRT